ncbi:hypothetical protein AVEN_89787-1 [Araneus ventricosus]|uniref:Histone-lysine N-methyltransferase SETMAR n=1 Tax=Araneus ventricosus TaxID=182803 RepID=A0A4Y2I3B5_ARAVE|nr:hypothetical protein AVEN_89787-1 [Araneus ventricosus]
MVVEAFGPSVHQFIENGIEEIRVQVAEPLNDGFLDFGIGSEMATCKLLLQQSEEMKITWCYNGSRNTCPKVSSTSTIETLEHPPYCRDLAPGDFHLFGLLKKQLARRHFRTDAEVQEAIVKWHRDLDPDFFYAFFDKLVHRWPKCFNNHGDYVEKYYVPVPFYLYLTL